MAMLKKIVQQMANLPEEVQMEAALFIDNLARHYTQYRIPKTIPAPLKDEPFVGMWKDREDLQDSTDWVHELRQKEWRG